MLRHSAPTYLQNPLAFLGGLAWETNIYLTALSGTYILKMAKHSPYVTYKHKYLLILSGHKNDIQIRRSVRRYLKF